MIKLNRSFCILTLTFFLSVNLLIAQTTWVSTQYLDNILPAPHHDSTNVGPKKICLTPNQSILSLLQINQNGDQSIYALDSLSKIKWSHFGSYVGGIYSEDCSQLLPCFDNGCVYIFRHINIPAQIKIFRLNSNGSVKWSKTYNEPPMPPFYYPLYIIPTFHNTFYVKFNNDSLVELNDNGNYIRSRTPFTGNITALPDSDFIVTDASQISRQNFSGSQVWSIPSQTFSVAFADSLYIYAHAHANVKKLKSSDGSLIWSIPATNNQVAVNTSGEFVTLLILNNRITKFDSSGIMQWTKVINLPNYNLTAVSEGPDFTWITGGCWRNFYITYPYYYGYSPMIIRIDSSGKGAVDTTDYFIVGNANDNFEVSFADDAVFIAASMNQTGPARDSLIRNDFHFPYYTNNMNVFASDWADSFPCGPNYKYSDFDGNGLIDSIDVRKLTELQFSFYHNASITPHWLKQNSNNSLPQIKLIFENNNLPSIFDTIRAYITLGSSSAPVDSIYGISIELTQNDNYLWSQAYRDIQYFPSSLGDTSTNLFYFGSQISSSPSSISMAVECRTDNQNVSLAGDTILKITCLLDSNGIFNNTLYPFLKWNVIDKNGCEIPLDFINDSLVIQTPNHISDSSPSLFQILPQPVDEYFNAVFSTQVESIQIFNSSGQLIKSKNEPGKEFQLYVKNLTNGIYLCTAHSKDKILKSKFIILHK